MSLGPGVHVGPYEILSAIGAGGWAKSMAPAIRVLKREVTLKMAPRAFDMLRVVPNDIDGRLTYRS
jgi:hypothetical protein